MKGKIVLIPFPFTDLSGSKRRPALVLLKTEKDVAVAYISSKTTILNDACLPIGEDHLDFGKTGLKTSSTIHADLIIVEIGKAGEAMRAQINDRLRHHYRF